MKLQKFLQEIGFSRRKAGYVIKAGEVRVNGIIVREPWYVLSEGDRVEVQRKTYDFSQLPPRRYLALHKPRGYITSRVDHRGRPTVFQLVESDVPLFSVGRLDYDTEGVLILTNDGELAYRLMHPKYQVERVYRVLVEGEPDFTTMERLVNGVRIGDELARAKNARVVKTVKAGTWLEITMTEGKKREIRRMLKAVGNPVKRLIRISYGPVHISLIPEPGSYVDIPPETVNMLKKLVGLSSDTQTFTT